MKNTRILLMISALFVCSCTNSDAFLKGKEQLENMGYTDIRSTGYNALCCGENDTFSNGFIATAKNGNVVTGCICSGLLKGITIRFE